MSRRINHAPAILRPPLPEARIGATIGRVCAVSPDGVAMVDFPGNGVGPLAARRIGVIDEGMLREAVGSGAPVVLVFEDGDPSRPLVLSICGALGEPVSTPVGEPVTPVAAPEASAELHIDGRRLVLQGTERIELRCGDASIVLCADGTLKLRGRDIASLARRRQRIKGGTVAIN